MEAVGVADDQPGVLTVDGPDPQVGVDGAPDGVRS